MTKIVLRLLSLLGLKSRLRPPNKPFFRGRGEGCRWIRGLRAQNPYAIGIQPVHTRVDSRGLQWTPAMGDSTRSDFALPPRRRRVGVAAIDLVVADRAAGAGHRRRAVAAAAADAGGAGSGGCAGPPRRAARGARAPGGRRAGPPGPCPGASPVRPRPGGAAAADPRAGAADACAAGSRRAT